MEAVNPELERLIEAQRRDDAALSIAPEFRGQVPLSSAIENTIGYEDGEIVTFHPRPPRGTLLVGTASFHGTRSGYVRGCRCVHCKAANTQYIRAYRERRNGN